MMPSTEYHAETGVRIKKARLALGLTQKEFAASLGIVQGFLSGIETGRKRPSDTLLIALSHTFGINAQWLRDGSGESFKNELAPDLSKVSRAPLLDMIPDNFPDDPGAISRYISVPDLPEGCYAIVCHGDFMSPTIRDGDVVIFRPESGQKKSGDIIIVHNRWGEPILRRYRVKDDEIYLAPDNPAYAPFQPDDGTRTIGIVVDVWRKVII